MHRAIIGKTPVKLSDYGDFEKVQCKRASGNILVHFADTDTIPDESETPAPWILVPTNVVAGIKKDGKYTILKTTVDGNGAEVVMW
ncbi:hypothetical protein [Ilyobacter polytropus]|uniref:Uncharacterized protein n=1 Tax=Ilyobacter polytropus (strain ATCC 51220 / DSM 2926 / LMG 16218 / CuHBu1) TaxID=572544 RepID=E3HBK3_ILYPC|nr:hypothetical protein [Ilyobacter polytropus]ADO83699.1 hypothetical protein Ilyop_1928 [Ilyobacter polytropus DSM 2926]